MAQWISTLLFLMALGLPTGIAQAAFPAKPITIVVHSKPGSGIDITSRQLAKIARKYSDATILVENKIGASGIIAMEEVLSRKSDGYTVLAVTKSFISTVLLSNLGFSMDSFNMLACLVIDPEALITNRRGRLKTFDDLLQHTGSQRWLGPMVGGVDHLMAVQVWDKAGIHADWIPYEGGSDAAASLMGRNGDVYVGNPGDTKGRPDLQVAVVAAKTRLADYPNVPTFLEKGVDIPSEVLWRGYAVSQGTDPVAIAYLNQLFAQVSSDPEWVGFIKSMAALPVYYAHDKFTEMVDNDQTKALKYLQLAGLMAEDEANVRHLVLTAGIIIGLLLLVAIVTLLKAGHGWRRGDSLIAALVAATAIFLYVITFEFPAGKFGGVGPASLPRLVLLFLLLFSVWLIVSNGRSRKIHGDRAGSVKQPLYLILLTILYLQGLQTGGYFLATFIFITAGVYLLNYRNYLIILLASGGFVVLSYLAFYKVLGVPLPLGVFN